MAAGRSGLRTLLMITLMSQKNRTETGAGEPVGEALGRDPGHDENDSLPGQGFRANL